MGRYWVIIAQNKSNYTMGIILLDDTSLTDYLEKNDSVILFYKVFEEQKKALVFREKLSLLGEKSIIDTIKVLNSEFNNLKRNVSEILGEK